MDTPDAPLANVLPEPTADFYGADGLPWQVVYLSHREALSEPFECTLVMTLPVPGAEPDALLGEKAHVEIRRGLTARRIQGVVRRVEDLGATATHRYVRAVVVPQLWALSQRMDSRIFQEMPVAAIVREVLKTAGVYQGDGGADVPGSLDGLPQRIYCLQHHETDLAFVTRLLEEEGIPYLFRHEGDDGETFALVEDSPRWPHVAGERGAFAVTDTFTHVRREESVQWFDLTGEQRPTGRTVRDYDFTKPRATLHLTQTQGGGARPVYDHPSRLDIYQFNEGTKLHDAHDGARQARVRFESAHARAVTGRGAGNATGFAPGHTFELSGHARHDGDGRYLLTRVEHVYQAWSDLPEDVRASEHLAGALRETGFSAQHGREAARRYVNRFECVPAATSWRPPKVTPRPVVSGAQSARVVGPSGEEIYVDFHGRIKVQFHWDRQGKEDERSSCWMRVSQAWAGPDWGFVFTPRIGMEVMVAFLDGDPDRPVVTGGLYNGENHTAYELPREKSRSTIKTRSTPGGDGYNELRFEDYKGSEEVYLRAQKDLNEWVLNDQGTKVDHNQTLTVGNNRFKTVKANERIIVEKNRNALVRENDALEVMQNLDMVAHGSRGATLQADETLYLRGDKRVVIECGESKIVMTPETIHISSQTVTVLGDKEIVIRGGIVKIN